MTHSYNQSVADIHGGCILHTHAEPEECVGDPATLARIKRCAEALESAASFERRQAARDGEDEGERKTNAKQLEAAAKRDWALYRRLKNGGSPDEEASSSSHCSVQ